MDAEVKLFFVHLFDKAAIENKTTIGDVELCFMLKSVSEFRCMYGAKEIEITDEEIRFHFSKYMNIIVGVRMIRGKINDFITKALLKFSMKNHVEKRNVNVLMAMDAKGSLVMKLRDGSRFIRMVSVSEIINSS